MSNKTLREIATVAYRVGSIAAIEAALRDAKQAALEMAAKVCENYGQEGHCLAKEYAADTAEELTVRIRELAKERAKL